MSNPSEQVKSIFLEAVEKHAPEHWAAFVARACADDVVLRAAVEKLLRAQVEIGSFHEQPAAPQSATVDEAICERPGTVMGAYKLLEQIGAGGFGVVFLAEQTEPVRRTVALKVLKPGMDTRQVVARFEAERQALAIMDHPNIAKVFDAGATPSGRPYFVMELVKGVPITEFCDQKHLAPRQRLALFVSVCQAVQHAHHKGIIHRDLKPSNILVAVHDDTPVPKVIDFGVAKALGQALTDKTLCTGYAQMIGTPLYMSPEQAGQRGLDIDTRSDIYSLGVLLYELLTGTTPFKKERFHQAAYDEIRRIIREEEPPKPSTRLSESKEMLPSISAQRHMEPAKLTRLVRGELDWIVMKALDKDRNRRYETASAFAMDVQRYLADEPVLAGPPSATYRLRKFLRRNKAPVAVAGLVLFFLVLLGSGIGWMIGDRAARQARVVAQLDLILSEVEPLANELKWPEALAVARRAEPLTAGDADAAAQVRVRQVLDGLEMVARLEKIRMPESALTDAEAGGKGRPSRYATAFREYGVDVEALAADEAAERLRARPTVAIALAAALDDWAHLVHERDPNRAVRLWALAGDVDPDPSRVMVRQAAATKDDAALGKLANVLEATRHPPQTHILLARSLRSTQPAQALALLERAGEAHPGDFWIQFELGFSNALLGLTRLEAALRHYTAARALRPRSAEIWTSLGAMLAARGQPLEAIACFRKAIELDENYSLAHSNLAVGLTRQGQLDEAIPSFRRAIELSPNDPRNHNSLGEILLKRGQVDAALECFKRAIQLDSTNAGDHLALGNALLDRKLLDEAILWFKKTIELAPNDPRLPGDSGRAVAASAHGGIGLALAHQGQVGESIAWFTTAIELDMKNARAHHSLGVTLARNRQWEEAVACFRTAIELDWHSALCHKALGDALTNQGKSDEALASYRTSIEIEPNDASCWQKLAALLTSAGRSTELDLLFQEVLASQERLDAKLVARPEHRPVVAQGQLGLAAKLMEAGRNREAEALLTRAVFNYDQLRLGSPAAVEYWTGLANCGVRLGQTRQRTGRLAEAEKPFHTALAARKRLAEMAPTDGNAIDSFASEHFRLAGLLAQLRRAPEAEQSYDQAAQLYEQAAKLGPRRNDALFAAAACRLNRAAQLAKLSRSAEVVAEYREALRLYGALPQDVQSGEPHQLQVAKVSTDLAWLLATSEEPKLRNAPEAVRLADNATKLSPQLGHAWTALGVARYRAEDWPGAAAALEKSIQLRKASRALEELYLAMAHARRDDTAKARAWYDRAVLWLDRNQPTDVEMRHLRTEAEALLGVRVRRD